MGCCRSTAARSVDGERVTEPIAGVAMVFQHFGLFPWKSVYDNVAYGLRMAGASRDEIAQRVPHFIAWWLAGFEKASPIRCRAACSSVAASPALWR